MTDVSRGTEANGLETKNAERGAEAVRTEWQRLLKEACAEPISSRVLTAFNTNVDVVVHLDAEKVRRLYQAAAQDGSVDLKAAGAELTAVRTPLDVCAALYGGIEAGKSAYWVIEDASVLAWLNEQLETETRAMGGQAGIKANQLAALGAQVSIVTPLLSPEQAQMFHEQVRTPVSVDGRLESQPVRQAARSETPTKINWIFEYAKGAAFTFGPHEAVAPRANRVILATRPEGAVMAFPESLRPHLPEIGLGVDVAFLAGYHYASSDSLDELDAYLADSASDLRALRSENHRLRLHYEYVPAPDAAADERILRFVGEQMHSLGINEREIVDVLGALGFERERKAIAADERAYTLYRGALALMRHLNLERIQLHNLGYYVFVLAKPYPVLLEDVRRAALFGSAVNAVKAQTGGHPEFGALQEASRLPLSNRGFQQVAGFEAELRAELGASPSAAGIWELEDHYVLVAPAHVVPDPVSTVGMGDTISSATYAKEACSFAGRMA